MDKKKMIIRLIAGGVIGAVFGGVLAYFGKCADGTCPLMASPLRGIIVGLIMGVLFALSTSRA